VTGHGLPGRVYSICIRIGPAKAVLRLQLQSSAQTAVAFPVIALRQLFWASSSTWLEPYSDRQLRVF
jgi:hypothetical protein